MTLSIAVCSILVITAGILAYGIGYKVGFKKALNQMFKKHMR